MNMEWEKPTRQVQPTHQPSAAVAGDILSQYTWIFLFR